MAYLKSHHSMFNHATSTSCLIRSTIQWCPMTYDSSSSKVRTYSHCTRVSMQGLCEFLTRATEHSSAIQTTSDPCGCPTSATKVQRHSLGSRPKQRDFENLKHEGDDGEPQPNIARRDRPSTKN
ncbi:Uncharacterized protein Fot_15059 [Forsythia ovata]|uniref:Uncharacterized protein n=1 Tax=Forsythia ovata TaxID=205694 RepID=A0ABD1W8E5_9LAMI